MSNSSLICYTKLSPNYESRQGRKISKITIHHMAGNLTIESCAAMFANPSREASANYLIGTDGRIALCVDEQYRAWTSGNFDNDSVAVTIEVANDGGAPDWHVSDAALEATIKLCVDICQRNDIVGLNFTGNANGNLTQHNYFQATACPGPYLKSKFQYIADEVNRRLSGGTYVPAEQVDAIYSAYTTEWLGEIVNCNDVDYTGYAGWAGRPMTGIRAKLSKGSIVYRAHTSVHGWLNWITNLDGYGYAGMYGTPIDGIQMYIKDLPENYHIEYRTGLLNGDWLSWIKDYGEGDYGYSGLFGNQLDRIQIRIVGDPIFVPAPKEEIKIEVEVPTTTEELYRIRLTWEDTKSQKGAYKNLDSAIAIAKANPGYSVYNSSGVCVYDGNAKEEPKIEEESQQEVEKEPEIIAAVYDLDYPEKTLIIDRDVIRTNADCVKAIKKILSNNSEFDIEIAKTFFELAPIYGIDPMMAISQSILETGWFKYVGSAVKPEHHNYCGLGVTVNGIAGGIFETIEDGVAAQLQHLFAYGCKDELLDEILDPRFKYVTRGIAPYWQQLAGRWAVPGYDKNTYATPKDAMNAGNTYGQKIRAIYNQIMAEIVTDEEEALYFGQEETIPEVDVQPQPEQKENVEVQPIETKEPIWIQLIRAILEAIINVFKNK